MFVAQRSSDDPHVATFEPPVDLTHRVLRRLRRTLLNWDASRSGATRLIDRVWFSDDRTQHGSAPSDQIPAGDILHLHWVARFIDYGAFFSAVPQHSRLVWTLHDMGALTGGCHCDLGCGKYVERCGACPLLGSGDPGDLSRQIWQRKSAALGKIADGDLHVVTPSRWLADTAKRSALFGRFPISIIPYGIDTGTFAPRDRQLARAVLGLPEAGKVILFVADYIGDERKGFPLLMQALKGLSSVTNDLVLISVGNAAPANKLPFPHFHLGYIRHDGLLSLIYSAADIFVTPTQQDNFPNTVLESLACGTPVVGFAVGGVPDMVRPGITGWLAPAEDVAALRQAILDALAHDVLRREMAGNCRRVAEKEYGLEVQARAYLALYRDILGENCGRQEFQAASGGSLS
jgi:glycosyltransferase involved in cell wall biosynthesis